MERTFLMVKPDGVKRGLVGEVYKRIERTGLKIVALKMAYPTKKQAESFYPSDKEWLINIGKKGERSYRDKGREFKMDYKEYGLMVKSWLVDFLLLGPVVLSVVEGSNAIEIVRKIVGTTEPRIADAGTIRGDYSADSLENANDQKRASRNLVHASTSKEDAEKEINFWFKKEEIVSYKRVDEELILGK